MKNFLMWAISFVLIFSCLGILYYFLHIKPQQEAELLKIEREKIEERKNFTQQEDKRVQEELERITQQKNNELKEELKLQKENNHSANFSLGQKVYLQWEIKSDGDIITHTHTIDDINYWVIWIKSDSVLLSDSWFVQATWIVDKIYQWNPIVKVNQISWSKSKVKTNVDDWIYLKWAWLLFLPSFFDEYVLLNEWENWEIHIQSIESWKEIILRYFRCDSSDSNKNCKKLSKSFENSNSQSFVTSEWDVYYKQNWTQSRFITDKDWFWIFINDISDNTIFKLKDLIKFANEKI